MRMTMDNKNLGMCGGMGKVIALYHLYNVTNEIEWKEQAEVLLEEVLLLSSNIASLSYSSGLLGVGTGIEWLFQKGYLCGDRDTILEDIDILATTAIIKRHIPNIDKMDGLIGLVCYIFYRMHYRKEEEVLIVLTLKEYTIYLIDWIIEEVQNNESEKEIYEYYFMLVILHQLNVCNAKIVNILKLCNDKIEEIKQRKICNQ